MSVFVLDTNILSFYMRKKERVIQNVTDAILDGHEVLIGPIAYYEVKRGLLAIKAGRRLREFSALCKVFGVGQIDNSILDYSADIYCELRDKKQTAEDADIITASFCIRHGFILVTNNVGHFENMSGLRYCDWA